MPVGGGWCIVPPKVWKRKPEEMRKMKKLGLLVVAGLFAMSMNASAWWIFGKKAAEEPAKEEAPAAVAEKAEAGSCSADKKAECKAKKAECKVHKAEKKAECDAKKAECQAKKAEKKAEKKAACDAKKVEKKAKSEAKKAEKAEKKAEAKAEAAPEAAAEAAPAAE